MICTSRIFFTLKYFRRVKLFRTIQPSLVWIKKFLRFCDSPPFDGQKILLNLFHLSLNKKSNLWGWWWWDEVFLPKWTRWWPMQDWAWNANESKFYNEIFHHPASSCSKEQNVFPLWGWEAYKKCKQCHCAGDGSSQLEAMLLFIRKNWVKLRWKFDFRRENQERKS